jgi:hypothetical protein
MKMPAVHYNFRVLEKQRFKKREPHEVVPMPVSEKKIVPITSLNEELISATPHTGTRIDDNNIIALGPNFQTSCIPPVLDVLGSGNRYGSSCSPASNNHRVPAGLQSRLDLNVIE